MSQSKNKNEQQHKIDSLREFDRSLPMSLLRAREAVMKTFIPTLKEHDMTPQQWRVIRSLEQEDGLELSELSKRCFLLKPSMSRIAQNLEARGLIERRKVSNDQRKSTLFLTKKGYALREQVAPKSLERYEYITKQFGYGKLELLYELLDELMNSLNNPTDDKTGGLTDASGKQTTSKKES